MANWTVTPSFEHDNNGIFVFPANTGEEDIEYTITYTDDNGISGKTTYTIPNCYVPPTQCESEWSIEFDSSGIYRQDLSGTGGTPISIVVKHNGSPVTNLSTNDFVLNIFYNGVNHNELFTDIGFVNVSHDDGRYVVYITKTSVDTSCNYIGDILDCTIAPKDCEEAKANFQIMIAEYDICTIEVTNMPSGKNSFEIGFSGKVGTCEHEVKMGDFTVYRVGETTTGKATGVSIFKNLVETQEAPYGLVVNALANTGGMCENPTCAKVTDFNGTTISVKYCGQSPCS